MKTKESFDKSMSEMFRQHDYRAMYEFYNTHISAFINEKDQTNAKLVEEKMLLSGRVQELKDENKKFRFKSECDDDTINKLQSELSKANERIKELEKNARQLCTLLAKDHVLFFLSQGEKDGIIDILKTLTTKQHG